ncbi:MAG: hypothetical protein HXS44_17110 [Theionarchaea archaeon]|nr:hypothetical protein [Theionarchaea archaeon]
MRCKNCGKDIDNMLGLCPYCGFFSGELEESFMNIARMFGGKAVIKQDGDSFIVILDFQGTRQAFRITPINLEEISPSLASSPEPVPAPPEPVPELRKRVFKKTVEPDTETNEVKDRIYIRVDLPGIPEEDIEIDELENSIEVRAYKGKTRFFKLIPIPETYHMISKETLSGEVIITLKK